MDTNNFPQKFGIILWIIGAFLSIFLALKSWEVISKLNVPDFNRPTISVSGQAKKFVRPDIGQINFSVLAQADDVSKAETEATNKIKKVIEALKEAGIAENDIKATNYSISPRYGRTKAISNIYPPDIPSDIIGYEVSQNLEVKIRDTKKTGEIISKVAGAGANQIGGLSFTIEKPEVVQAELRKQAIEDAKKNARELEKDLGMRLGKIISFNESGGYPIYRDYAFGKGMGGAEMSAVPQLPVGENEVSVNVNIIYQVK